MICLRYNVKYDWQKILIFLKDLWTSWLAEYMYVYKCWLKKACKKATIKIHREKNRIHSLNALDYISYVRAGADPENFSRGVQP